MSKSLDKLVSELEVLKKIISAQDETIETIRTENDKRFEILRSENNELITERNSLLEQLRLALKREFGRSCEASPGQHDLFDEAETEQDRDVDTDVTEAASEPAANDAPNRKKPGRKPLPAHLPRIEVVFELDEASAHCAEDGSALKVIGEEVTEQLAITPAKISVLRKIRKTYACPTCESVQRAPKLADLLPKSRASAELLAHIAIHKYQDGLPLYRQQKMFERLGVTLDRTTMANWMVAVGQKLKPLIDQMRIDALAAEVLHADETTVQVLKEPDRRPDQKSYMWVQSTGTGSPMVIYHYAPGRSGEVVDQLFGDYRGTLVTDGYAAYQRLAHASHAGCWAHARRKFHDALQVQKGQRTGKAQVGFNFIQRLFVLERQWANLSTEQRLEQRQLTAQPLIDGLAQWFQKSLPLITPKSQLGRAMIYLHKQWGKLTVFLQSGDVPIHNNQAENKIRPFVISRKNWMFNDSVKGAESSAAIYSLIETAKANDLAPDMYLRWLFNTLPNADTTSSKALRALLPYGVDPDMIVQSLADKALSD